MMKYAIVLNEDVIDVTYADFPPTYPPTNDGILPETVEIPEGVDVSIGMKFISGEFVGTYAEQKKPKTKTEILNEKLKTISDSQLIMMEALAEQYEEGLVRDLNNMETQATIYEAILELGGIE